MLLFSSQVYSFVKLAGLYYAGSHGMDIKGPSKSCKYKKVSASTSMMILAFLGVNIVSFFFFWFVLFLSTADFKIFVF